jgi:hypothetical protein
MRRDLRWLFLCINAASVALGVAGGSTLAVGLGAACGGFWSASLIYIDD